MIFITNLTFSLFNCRTISFLAAVFGISDSEPDNKSENKYEGKGDSDNRDVEKNEKDNQSVEENFYNCSDEFGRDKELLLSKTSDTSASQNPNGDDNYTNQDIDDKDDNLSSLGDGENMSSIQVSNSTQSVSALLTTLNESMNDNNDMNVENQIEHMDKVVTSRYKSHPDLETINISSELDENDDISTMTSVHSHAFYDNDNMNHQVRDIYHEYLQGKEHEDETLQPEEKKRISKVQKLISKRDWGNISRKALSFYELDVDNTSREESHDIEDDQVSLNDFGYDSELVDRLNSSVHAGDWAAVVAISNDLSGEHESN